MIDKVKEWCESELTMVKKHDANPAKACDRCYGIVMFVSNAVLGYDSPEGQELAQWWDDEMLPQFRM